MPDTHSIKITPYWLLGLIECEGTFCLSEQKKIFFYFQLLLVTFSITLTAAQAPVMHAIKKKFFDVYGIEDNVLKTSPQYLELVSQRSYLAVKKATSSNAKPCIEFRIRQLNFIANQLIPMLSRLSFVTKKYKDFKDWMFIVSFIYKGKHNIEAGRELK